jgi:hypothetical protein
MAERISGTLSALYLCDVCDEIRLEDLRAMVGAPPPGRKPDFRQPAPEYVAFANAPVTEPLATRFESPGPITGRVSYYDYGVVGLRLDFPFSGGWDEAIDVAVRWMNDAGLEQRAGRAIEEHVRKAAAALVNPYAERLTEDYFVFHVSEIEGRSEPLTAGELLDRHGDAIAQIVRGERARFSPGERAEILESRMSYLDTDLLVVGWSAALIYDTPEGAAPTMQLLEYANTQLLEFRHYDEVLTRLLSGMYRSIEKGTSFLARWRLAREADRLNTIRLEARELAERVDNSLKFLSDMFAARLYRMAAAKIGAPDYRRLVEQKLDSAGELYAFMMDQFHHGRAFLLELMIVIILIIDLIYLFRGKA